MRVLDNKNSIMVVDDCFDSRELLADAIKEMGYRVYSYENGHRALEHIHLAKRCDLMLLDIEMPGFSGLEILQQINSMQSMATLIPKVIVSGISNAEVQGKALELGALRFLEKPFSLGFIRKILSHYLYETIDIDILRSHIQRLFIEDSQFFLSPNLVKGILYPCRFFPTVINKQRAVISYSSHLNPYKNEDLSDLELSRHCRVYVRKGENMAMIWPRFGDFSIKSENDIAV